MARVWGRLEGRLDAQDIPEETLVAVFPEEEPPSPRVPIMVVGSAMVRQGAEGWRGSPPDEIKSAVEEDRRLEGHREPGQRNPHARPERPGEHA